MGYLRLRSLQKSIRGKCSPSCSPRDETFFLLFVLHFWPAASAPRDQSASELLIFIAPGGLDVTRYLPSLAPRQASRVLLSLRILCAAPESCCSGRCGERKPTHSHTHFILGLTTLGSGQVHGSSLQGPCSRSRPVPSAHLSPILPAVCDAC